jgi:hypothetical protein
LKIGFALTGSFCTFSKAIAAVKDLVDSGFEVFPIMSETSYNTDTRFGDAEFFRNQLTEITGNPSSIKLSRQSLSAPKRCLMFSASCLVRATRLPSLQTHCGYLGYNGCKKPSEKLQACCYRRFN